jgi:hypothetical protein
MRSSSTQQLFRLQVVEGPPCPSLFREQLEASLKRLRQENRRLMMERQLLLNRQSNRATKLHMPLSDV